jgi:hypothetical protein
MGQWEYKFLTATLTNMECALDVVRCVDGVKIDRTFPIQEALNELGKDGWELVQVALRGGDNSHQSHTYYAVYILKRFVDEEYIGETSSMLAILRAGHPPPR